MKEILNKLFAHHKLSEEEARQVLLNISSGQYNPMQIAVFMGVYMMRSVTVDELKGFRDALLELCIRPDSVDFESIDMCGTGGDGKNTFNISTTSAFVVAGAGYKVTKHGNYGVSSLCGSSNVLESLGYQFSNDYDKLMFELDQCNICFLHAPLFHPAMKNVAPIRKQLGVKTFFNMLGPLVNPIQPSHQSVGVFSLSLARLYQYIFETENTSFSICYSLDGYDEFSLTGNTYLAQNDNENIISASDLDLPGITPPEIYGGNTIEEAKGILLSVLNNKSTSAQKNVVIANAALAIKCFEKNKSSKACAKIAEDALESGKAKNVLNKLLQTNAS